jgi:magnesium transporter
MPADILQADDLRRLLEKGEIEHLVRALCGMDPADVADLLEDVDDDEQREQLFDLLDTATASDVLVELETPFVDDVVEDMSSRELAQLAERMAPDDAVQFLENFDEEDSNKILAEMSDPALLAELLKHEEDTAGQIMTTELFSVSSELTVQETRSQLVPLEPTDPVFFVYVCDPITRKLEGIVSLKELYQAPPTAKMGDITSPDFIYATTSEDQEEVARKFRKYDLWVIPVVDSMNRLVGRITVDDIMDVIHEEADEDLARMVGAPDIETEEDSPLLIARLRLPWLLVTMMAGLVNSVIIRKLLNVTDEAVTLAVFIPAVMAMGGNTGIQSSAVAIRGIALGYKGYNRLFQIIWREIRVGITLGVVCGTLTGLAVALGLNLLGVDTGGISPDRLGLVVGLAMGNGMAFASCYGSLVPVLLHRLGADPAVASGPFVTTSTDLSAAMIYFVTCVVLL